jgi:3D (Asp-Asp-Asp) domain-containing protein
MALIANSDLQTILDKLARFASEAVGDPEFAAGLTAGFDTASTDVFGPLATFILALNEEDQVADLLPAARDLDQTHPEPPTGFLINVKSINAMLTALDTHCKRFGYTSLDNRLTVLNASVPTLRAHGLFRRYLGKITAPNSFIPNDVALAKIVATGATTGTFTHLATIDKTQYAGAKLVAKNVGALGGTTGITITGVKLDGTTATLTASITTTTDAFETNLSVTTKLFINVTAISITGSTSGNRIDIVAKTDRDISAA